MVLDTKLTLFFVNPKCHLVTKGNKMVVLANQIQKLNQPIFDQTKIDEWKKKAPKFYSKYKGVTYIDTIILNRSLVVYDEKEQVRQLKVIMENVPSIKKSFENGIQYDEQPPSVEKNGKIHFDIISIENCIKIFQN